MKITSPTFGLLLAIATATSLRAQDSVFTYQGRLNMNGVPVSGQYDFMFRLMNDPTNGVAAPVIPINLAVTVANGLFTTGLDFGTANFNGANRWLEINVRTNGDGSFTTLSPRQLLTPTPYAISANTASNLLGALPANQISGTILSASLPASPSFSGTVTANNFSGNGANLTNLNAVTLGGLNSSNFWGTTGNAGTTAGAHFIGTTDNQPVELRVGGQRALRLEWVEFDNRSAPNIIGGSELNSVMAGILGATIGGGGSSNVFGLERPNEVRAHFSTIGGGVGNAVQDGAWASTIGGGDGNRISPYGAAPTIGGGQENLIGQSSHNAVIAGGHLNAIGESSAWSVISGGQGNIIETTSSYSTIGGGTANSIQPFTLGATIGGGGDNIIGTGSRLSVISGGWANQMGTNSDYATIAGGQHNVTGMNATDAAIGGGAENSIGANARFATVPGGFQNSAAGPYSFAAGNRAKANHEGAFVWGDSTDADIPSTNANSVTMRASGGYRLFTDTNATTGAFLAAGSGSWTSMSDRNVKANFRATDARAVLDKVVALPVQTWNYKSQDAGIRHIGPMAQDFKAAFEVGESDTGIATVDADGVALAAIQGLNQKLEETRAENVDLRKRLEKLEQLMHRESK